MCVCVCVCVCVWVGGRACVYVFFLMTYISSEKKRDEFTFGIDLTLLYNYMY